jgi:hypothetical protein
MQAEPDQARVHPICAELGARIEVVQAKVEDLDLHGEVVDVLISEPMGTLLVNERMLETYLHARDHLLAPGGRMFPVRALCPSSFPCLLPHSQIFKRPGLPLASIAGRCSRLLAACFLR